MRRLAIITTHPIQYNAPLFRLLTERGKIKLKVFYTWGEGVLKDKFDPGFGKTVQWDIPLLEGYEYHFTKNVAKDPGSHHFAGINNPYLISEINAFEPEAILVYGWSFKSHLKVLRYYKHKIPVMFRGDSNLLDSKGFISTIKRKLFLKWVYSHVDIALYVGKNNFKYFGSAGLKNKQLVFAPHAVENNRFECVAKVCVHQSIKWIEKMDFRFNDLIILFAGKLEYKKAPDLLLRAFSACKFDNSVNLVMVGNGELEMRLKEEFANQNNIRFLDFQNQSLMPSIYKMADVFVLPSRGPGETWGLSVNEAMANGKPIIISDKCGCAIDLVEEGENGFIFKSEDVNDLTLKLKLMVEDRNKMIEMGKKSKEKIKSWNYGEVCKSIENCIY